MTIKEKVLKTIRNLPAGASIEDAMERLLFLAKIERGFTQDILDCKGFVKHAVKMDRLKELFNEVEGDLFRYPAINKIKLDEKINNFINEQRKSYNK